MPISVVAVPVVPATIPVTTTATEPDATNAE
jgi:hypothetical protein